MSYKDAKGWLTDPERETLFQLAGEVPAGGLIINIGVEFGASVVCFIEGRKRPDVRIVGIDVELNNWQGGPLPDGVRLIEVDSGEAALNWGKWRRSLGIVNEEVDFLFVDGDHSYLGVQRDMFWTGYVRKGGVVIYHDCYEWPFHGEPGTTRRVCPGVNRAVSEWFSKNERHWKEHPYVDSMRIFERI